LKLECTSHDERICGDFEVLHGIDEKIKGCEIEHVAYEDEENGRNHSKLLKDKRNEEES
jgi:hypothetical protein